MNKRRDGGALQARHACSAMSRCRRRRDEAGQALIEFALVLPLVLLLMGSAFNGWNAMQLSVRLTSAARVGAIEAAHNLAIDAAQTQTALADATTAINEEEGVTGVYQDSNSSASNYVSLSQSTQVANGVSINVVTITISEGQVPLIPVVRGLSITAHAAASYS